MTSTSSSPALRHGSRYRFQVQAKDQAGNWSPYATSPTFTFARYAEDHPAVTYVGAWSKVSSSSLIGGTARSSSSKVKSATFTFTGADVGWVATRYTSSGKANVFIDGALVTTVDLDTSSTRYRQLVFARHFATSGTHTLRIEPVGDGRVDIDAFVVLR